MRIPDTDSIEELARFWATHDLTDFESDLEEVREPVFERRNVLAVPLRPEELRDVEKAARSRGVAQEELVHEWILEKLQTR